MEKAIERQRVLLEHLRPSSSSSHSFEGSLSASACLAGDSAAYQRTSLYGDDVVIVAAHRTALCKAKRGNFKDTYPDDLLAPVLRALIEKTNLDPSEVGDIVVGTVLAPGSQRASECRMSAFYAGFPETVAVRTVNRQCSSGLQAVADVAAAIKEEGIKTLKKPWKPLQQKSAHRTALCKAKRGNFKDTYPDDLLAPVLRALIEKTNLDPSEVGDIVVGTVLAPGSQRASECRMSAFYAGFPGMFLIYTAMRIFVSLTMVLDSGIGAGLESMTTNPMAWEGSVNPAVKKFEQAQNCLLPMGVTSENVAHRFGVSRQEQDQAAVDSHRKAAAATAAGKFKDEIIPVKTKLVDPKTGDETPITVSVDDGIRASTTLATLGKLKPVFKKDGTTTAGNSSQVSDGAGAVLLMRRSVATRKGLPVLGVFRTFAAVGVDPAIMGVGPAVAIPAAVKAAGLELDDIDLFEINEAFASQFVYCRNKLGLDAEKINVNGGAMAIGHPLGATGARCVATLLHEMKRRGKDCRFGVVSMCIGTGMGAAAVFERGDGVDELRNARKVEAQGYLSKDAR
ncbi:hypothetical protein F2Q69_00001553 [Brassica cretica]|uniref:acetyl-CoA C-acyltransferase n=1 Tax=Brassica cretica TaxID=69181 RepID=A0A8S9P0B1_BRACR|nr:hypothetical protein F2Q69_00001553 [Brassica cretica]